VTRALIRWAGNVAALWLAAELFDRVSYGGDAGTLVVAALVFSLVNWVVKPIVTILSLPLIIVTLGVALFFVNLLMLLITSWLVDGFRVDWFWPAVGATVVVWAVNTVLSAAFHDSRRARRERARSRRLAAG
jgi:putative membrane protein